MSSTVFNGRIISQIRKIKATTQSLSGVFPFRGQGVSYESGLERDFIRMWSLSPEVKAIVAQPVEIPFVGHNGQTYTYTPDFFVHFDERYGLKPLLIEVKLQEQWIVKWREWLPKWKAAWRYAREQGWEFHIYDESRIRQMRLRNVHELQRYGNWQFDPALTTDVLATLFLMKAAPLGYLLARHFTGHEAIGRSHLLHLIATEQVFVDLDSPLNDNTVMECRDGY